MLCRQADRSRATCTSSVLLKRPTTNHERLDVHNLSFGEAYRTEMNGKDINEAQYGALLMDLIVLQRDLLIRLVSALGEEEPAWIRTLNCSCLMGKSSQCLDSQVRDSGEVPGTVHSDLTNLCIHFW